MVHTLGYRGTGFGSFSHTRVWTHVPRERMPYFSKHARPQYILGIRTGLSAPIGHTLDLAVRPNELRNICGGSIEPSIGTAIMPYTSDGLSMRKPNAEPTQRRDPRCSFALKHYECSWNKIFRFIFGEINKRGQAIQETLAYIRKKTGGLETTIRYRIKISRYIMRYFHTFGTYRCHYRENVLGYLDTDTMRSIYLVTKREKKQGKNENRKTQHKQSCTQVAGRIMRGQGWCLLVVWSVLWCVHLTGNRRTTKKARRKTR